MGDIIAIGGAAFSAEPRNLSIDRYILDQTKKDRPNVLFIPTATGDADPYIAKFYAAYASLDAKPLHLSFFQRTVDLRHVILAQDAIYVGGGNTKSMLAVWADWGLPDLLKQAWASGTVLAGVSAGAICWFDQGVTDSWADSLQPLNCLGLLAGSCCPHYDSEAERRPSYHALLAKGSLKAGIAIEDGVAVHYRNGELERVVTSRERAKAYHVSAASGVVREDPIAATVLEKIQ
jgi:dipeptidase E